MASAPFQRRQRPFSAVRLVMAAGVAVGVTAAAVPARASTPYFRS